MITRKELDGLIEIFQKVVDGDTGEWRSDYSEVWCKDGAIFWDSFPPITDYIALSYNLMPKLIEAAEVALLKFDNEDNV